MAVQQTFEFLAPATAIQLSAKTEAVKAERASTTPEPAKKRLKKRPAKQGQARNDQTKQEQLLERLRGRVHGITTASKYRGKKETFSTGSQAIDQCLPGSGLRVDAVNEWVADGDACGAAALSLAIAATRLKTGSLVVVADNNHFYPPAAAAVGIDPSKVIWVRSATTADSVWAIDQALRCTGVSAVWASVGAWLDDRDARRFQLAAEAGRTAGFFVRPRSVRGRPTFAEVRFHVAISKQTRAEETRTADLSLPTWTLTLDRCQGSHAGIGVGRQIEVTMDHSGRLQTLHSQTRRSQNISASRSRSHESAAVCLASQLAHPKTTSSTNSVRVNSGSQREKRA